MSPFTHAAVVSYNPMDSLGSQNNQQMGGDRHGSNSTRNRQAAPYFAVEPPTINRQPRSHFVLGRRGRGSEPAPFSTLPTGSRQGRRAPAAHRTGPSRAGRQHSRRDPGWNLRRGRSDSGRDRAIAGRSQFRTALMPNNRSAAQKLRVTWIIGRKACITMAAPYPIQMHRARPAGRARHPVAAECN